MAHLSSVYLIPALELVASLDTRTQLCEHGDIKGSEFLRKVQRLAKKNGVVCHFSGDRGKGSHGTLYYGAGLTAVKDRDL